MVRWKVTLLAGAITTTAAMFPALVMKLLDFVALYGLVLIPMGAVILADYYLIPRLGLQPYYAEKKKIQFQHGGGSHLVPDAGPGPLYEASTSKWSSISSRPLSGSSPWVPTSCLAKWFRNLLIRPHHEICIPTDGSGGTCHHTDPSRHVLF